MTVAAPLHEPVRLHGRAPSPVDGGGRARWYRRRGSKTRGFYYVDARGKRITDAAHLARIRALVIPPAWTDVRISPKAKSCLQAVGLDTSGRIQYLYSEKFCEQQKQRKFSRVERFGETLPLLRRATNDDLARAACGRERVLAVVVRLINELYFRVGSEGSVKRYRTYGITTLRNRHLAFEPGGKLVFRYVGKHHIQQRKVLVDAQLAAVMREIKAIGGPKLFEYKGDDGRVHAVTPRDVNAYIKTACGAEYCAKDFRTWGGTLMAAVLLAETGVARNEREAKRNINQVVRRVAERLGNTPAVARGSYIHPTILDAYARGMTLEHFRPAAERAIARGQLPEYLPEELALLKLFRAAAAQSREHAGTSRRAA